MISNLGIGEVVAAIVTVAFSIVSAMVRREVRAIEAKVASAESTCIGLAGKVHAMEIEAAVRSSQVSDMLLKLGSIERTIDEVRSTLAEIKIDIAKGLH